MLDLSQCVVLTRGEVVKLKVTLDILGGKGGVGKDFYIKLRELSIDDLYSDLRDCINHWEREDD